MINPADPPTLVISLRCTSPTRVSSSGSGASTAELFAWRALDALRAAPRRWGATPVFFYGFDDMTALERDAIETLSRIVEAQVTASLTYEPGRVALAARATVAQELATIATTVRTLPAGAEYYQDAARPALHQLERFVFEQAPDRLDPGGAVSLMEAGGELAEAELIAAEVLDFAAIRGEARGDRCRLPLAAAIRSPA